jgi:sulfur-oxidizing protein SoxY
MHPTSLAIPTRRALIGAGAGLLSVALLRPAAATPDAMAAAIKTLTGGAELRTGRVTLDLPPLVENGNSVPCTIAVESPMSESDHIRTIALFNERNPQPNVIVAHLGPRAGRARLVTRIRLGGSQRVVALAITNTGEVWSASTDVVVTLAACVEG